MEVILKKTKITGSIIAQMLWANVEVFKDYEVLGFCVLKNVKWIVFYEPSLNDIRKYPMRFTCEAKTDNSDKPFRVYVSFPAFISHNYFTIDELASQKLIDLLNNIKIEANVKGQFYI